MPVGSQGFSFMEQLIGSLSKVFRVNSIPDASMVL
jgi:hypothetical protein